MHSVSSSVNNHGFAEGSHGICMINTDSSEYLRAVLTCQRLYVCDTVIIATWYSYWISAVNYLMDWKHCLEANEIESIKANVANETFQINNDAKL